MRGTEGGAVSLITGGAARRIISLTVVKKDAVLYGGGPAVGCLSWIEVRRGAD